MDNVKKEMRVYMELPKDALDCVTELSKVKVGFVCHHMLFEGSTCWVWALGLFKFCEILGCE